MPATVSPARYRSGLRSAASNALRSAIGGSEVALVDAAAYSNPGDCAITSGTLSLLNELEVPIRHIADRRHFDADALSSSLKPDTVILLQGGGNLGDTWSSNQELRESVIDRFRGHRIIQLPQSIHFHEERRAAQFARLVASHGGVELMLRDLPSLHFATKWFECDARLVPDLAFGWEPGPRSVTATEGVRIVRRFDRESVGSVDAPLADSDWPRDAVLARRDLRFGSWWIAERATRLPIVGSHRVSDRLGRAFLKVLARRRVLAIGEWLASAEALVTDRLHGHVLATLLDVPHVMVDNANGKVFDFDDSWPGLPASFVTRAAGWDDEEIESALVRISDGAGGR